MSADPTDCYGDRWLSGRPIYLTELDRCQPAEAMAPEARQGRWRLLPYETDAQTGAMLYASAGTAAPAATYKLGVRGWHAVSIGVMPADSEFSPWEMELLVRLSGDPAFTVLNVPPNPPAPGFGEWTTELFWKIADLTDQDLSFGQVSVPARPGDAGGPFDCPPARAAYIKLVPLSAAEAAAVRSDRSGSDTRRLYAHNDAHGCMGHSRPHTAEHMRRMLEVFRDTDFARIYWEAGGGDLLNYFTQRGRQITLDGLDDYGHSIYRNQIESWRMFRAIGVDPFDVVIDHAHELGLEFHASWRVSGFHYPPPLDYFNHGASAFKQHPEWRGRDRAGNTTPRLSFAHPGFRAYAVSLLAEMAARPIDGVCLLFNRRPPFLEYETPLVDSFKEAYGEDPHALRQDDPRWLAHRADTMTQLMREVRAAMDAATQAQSRRKRIGVSAIIFGNEEENLRWGLDARAWVREGLVDTLVAYTSAPELNSRVESWPDPAPQLRFHRDVVAGTPCVLAANLFPRGMPPDEYRRRAAAIYATGIDRLFIWDCANSAGHDSFTALRRLGHVDELQAWAEAGEPSLEAEKSKIRVLGDWDFRYGTPG